MSLDLRALALMARRLTAVRRGTSRRPATILVVLAVGILVLIAAIVAREFKQQFESIAELASDPPAPAQPNAP